MVAIKAIARLLARAVILVSALTLIVTAALKIQDPASFHDALKAHGVIPAFALDAAPYLAIALELLVGVGAVWSAMQGRWRTGALATASLFACFAVYAFALVIRPPAAPSSCGCGFSTGIVESWTPIAVRNGVLFVVLVGAALVASNRATQKAETPEAELRASHAVV